jgi:lipopolysaccharide heptosyltransferase II
MPSRRQRLRLGLLRTFATLGRPWRAAHPPRWTSSPHVLLIRPDHIGDLLFATPAIRDLRQALPDAHLTAMVGPWAAPALEHSPWLNDQLVCEFPGFTRQPKGSLLPPYRMLFDWARRLREQSFDVAVVLRFDHWWGALLGYLAGVPCRVGYAVPECQPFLTHAVPYQADQHEVVQNEILVSEVPGLLGQPTAASTTYISASSAPLEFHPRNEEIQYARRYLQDRGIPGNRPLVIIHPGAGAPVKQWLPDRFAAVASELMRRWQASIVITGSRNELDLAWTIAAHMDADPVIACGDTTLGQLAALFQLSQLVIGPDSGPLHLAVAVGTPSVHLYGPVDPAKFGPWGPAARHLVLAGSRDCIPCNRLDYGPSELPQHPCVAEIPVEAVLAAVANLLNT